MKKKYYDEALKFKSKQAKIVLVVSIILIVILGLYSYSKKSSDLFHFLFFVAMFSFPLLAIVFKAYKLHSVFQKFGETFIELDPNPGSIGGQLGGFVRFPTGAIKNTDDNSSLKIEVECVNDYAISSRSLQRAEEVLLKFTGTPKETIQRTDINGEQYFTFPFVFNLPKNLPASNSKDESRILWRILVKKEGSVFDKFELAFEVPVSSDLQMSELNVSPFNEINHIEENEQISHSQIEQANFALEKSLIQRKVEKNHLIYYFPNFRFKMFSTILLFFSSIFISILLVNGFHFILFVMALFFSSACLLVTFNSLKLEIDREQIKTTRTFLLFYKLILSKPIEQMTSLDVLLSYTVDKGKFEKHFFKIRATFLNDKHLTLAEGIPLKQNAEKMKNEIHSFVQKK